MTLKHFDVATWEFDQAEANRGTLPVLMDAFLLAEIPLDQDARIATSGLCGCTAVASTVKLRSGDRIAYLSHYQPRNHARGVDRLEAYYTSLVDRGIDPATLQTVIMRPANVSGPMNDRVTNELTKLGEVVPRNLGSTRIVPYRPIRGQVEAGAGTLALDIQASGEATILANLSPVSFE